MGEPGTEPTIERREVEELSAQAGGVPASGRGQGAVGCGVVGAVALQE